MFKMSVIRNRSVSTEQPKYSAERKWKSRNQINHHANDCTNHWSFLKFREISWNC